MQIYNQWTTLSNNGQCSGSIPPADALIGAQVFPNQNCFIGNKNVNEVPQEVINARRRFKERTGGDDRFIPVDNTEIDAMYYSGINSATRRTAELAEKTIIFFNGMNSNYYHMDDYVNRFRERGINVVLFNYRNIGQSVGQVITRQGLVNDGRAVIDHIHRVHGVALNKIAVFSLSMGGGISGEVAANHFPSVNVVNAFSYASFGKAIEHCPFAPGGQKLKSLFSSVIQNSNFWQFDTAENWKKIQGSKVVVHHERDLIIPPVAGLAKAVTDSGATQNTTIISLQDPGTGLEDRFHCRNLRDDETEAVLKSLFPDYVPAAEGPQRSLIAKIALAALKFFYNLLSVVIFPIGIGRLVVHSINKNKEIANKPSLRTV